MPTRFTPSFECADLRLPLEDSPYLLDQHGPIFVMGCPRSGTTFLAESIGAIRNVEYISSVLMPPRAMHLLGSDHASSQTVQNLSLILRDLLWQAFWRRHQSRSERVLEWFRGNIHFSEVWAKEGQIPNGWLCYKEPFLAFAVSQIAHHFPGAKFIHIVRDGLDCADSLERRYPDALSDRILVDAALAENKSSEIGVWRNADGYCIPWWVEPGAEEEFIACTPFSRYVWMWREIVSRQSDRKHELGERRFLEVRYETLVRDPDATATQVLKFLGIAEDRRFRRRLAHATAKSVGISFKRQTADQIRSAERVAARCLAEFGYR